MSDVVNSGPSYAGMMGSGDRELDGIIDRNVKAPQHPRSELEKRIQDELNINADHREKVLGGAPDDVPEIAREVMMLQGALQSVEQRVAAVVAVCRPALSDETLAALLGDHPGRALIEETSMHPRTELGMKLRALQHKLGHIEDKLGSIAHGVRL